MSDSNAEGKAINEPYVVIVIREVEPAMVEAEVASLHAAPNTVAYYMAAQCMKFIAGQLKPESRIEVFTGRRE